MSVIGRENAIMMSQTVYTEKMDDIIQWCSALSADGWLAADEVEAATLELLSLGWRIREWGDSAEGTPIQTLSYGKSDTVIAAYGYPHPDEPIGATALLAFGRAVVEHGLPLDVQFDIMLCADPDGAEQNQQWVKQPTMATYLRHNWHPHYLGLEIDYAFPIDWGPFVQPPYYTPDSGKAPLPESLAIAAWLQARTPRVLGLMHNEHVSGVYQFLLQRPSRETVAAFDLTSETFGAPIHRGERPDPGERWIRARTDVLKERNLKHRVRELKKHVGEIGDGRWLTGPVSVAQYYESIEPTADVLTPEIGMWFSPGINDTTLSDETRAITVTREETKRGQRLITRGQMTFPDSSTKTVCYAIEHDDQTRHIGDATVPVTRGMLGVEAVEERRWWLGQADDLWTTAQPKLVTDTLRRREREATNIPARLVKDRAMLIFRTADQYRQRATVAHVADFHGRWRFHTARLLGWNLQLYQEAGISEAYHQELLLSRCEATFPPLQAVEPTVAVRSVIARWLLLAQARLSE